MTRRELDDRTAEALLAGRPVADEPALSALVAQMRSLTPTEAPGPNAALAELLAHGLPEAAVGALAARTGVRRRAVSWVVAHRAVSWSRSLQVGLGAAVVTVALAGGAAANALPPVVQTAVADVVEAVTPLTVPRPQPAEPVLPTRDPVPAPSASTADSDDSEGRSGEPRGSDGKGPGRSDDNEDSRRDSSGRSGSGDADGAEDTGDTADREGDAKDTEDARPSARPSVSEREDDRSGSSGSGRDPSSDDRDADRDAEPTPRPEVTPQPDGSDRSGSSRRTTSTDVPQDASTDLD